MSQSTGKINVLSREMAELIAAGEVIDRPASVVKELLENAIDSGANVITVEIKNGGRTYIRVTDNGSGILKSDIPVAFLRHATSKITSKPDLDNIMTLGFRGEALASIAAVSKVDLLTKVSAERFGTHYRIEGSKEVINEDSGCQDGTTIIVRDIFYNVPARLKFLKKDVTEGNSVAAIVNKLAVSHPEISFKFIRDNKNELLTAGDGKIYSAIYSVFGREFAKTLIPVNYSSDGITVKGYICKPLESKSKRTFQNFYINNRYIKSMTCMVALEEAYKNSIMTGRFPACVLMLDIPPSLIDVNVHPTKIEVRFSDERLIYNSVFFAVKNGLLQNDQPTELNLEKISHFRKENLFITPEKDRGVQMGFDFSAANNQPQEVNSLAEQRTAAKNYTPKTENLPPVKEIDRSNLLDDGSIEQLVEGTLNVTENEPIELDKKSLGILRTDDIKMELSGSECDGISDKQDENDRDEFAAMTNGIREFKYISSNSFVRQEIEKKREENRETSSLRLVGEVFRTYIVVEFEGEMFLIDKHAAHERYNFEKLKKQETKLSVQLFIEPVVVMLTFEEYDALIANLDTVRELGFSIEDDVAPGVAVLGMPSLIEGTNPKDIIPEIADNFLRCKNNPQTELIDELFHSIACKSSIRANDKNSPEELNRIVEMVFSSDEIRYCPHGRPVMIKLTKRDIEKQFRRVL